MREGEYKTELRKKIEQRLPGSLVLKNDANDRQGIPDLTVLYKNRWAFLEVKTSENASQQPNQEFYVEQAADNSFGAFIYPENEEEVLDALQQSLEPRRKTRVSKSKQLSLD